MPTMTQWQKKYSWDIYQELLKWEISIYINLKIDSYSLRTKSFLRHVSDIIKMRYINILNTQIDSSYFNIDKPKGDRY